VVDVDHEKDCTRHVQSVELTLGAAGAPPGTAAPRPVTSGSVAVPTPVASSVFPQAISTPLPTPAAPSAPPASNGTAGGSNSNTPASAGSPSVGVFPDESGS
jgi:hypothetical protein